MRKFINEVGSYALYIVTGAIIATVVTVPAVILVDFLESL